MLYINLLTCSTIALNCGLLTGVQAGLMKIVLEKLKSIFKIYINCQTRLYVDVGIFKAN